MGRDGKQQSWPDQGNCPLSGRKPPLLALIALPPKHNYTPASYERERRHDLKTNALARGVEGMPRSLREYGSRILLVVLVAAIVFLLVRYWNYKKIRATAQYGHGIPADRRTVRFASWPAPVGDSRGRLGGGRCGKSSASGSACGTGDQYGPEFREGSQRRLLMPIWLVGDLNGNAV